jgi:hypothetical protein
VPAWDDGRFERADVIAVTTGPDYPQLNETMLVQVVGPAPVEIKIDAILIIAARVC